MYSLIMMLIFSLLGLVHIPLVFIVSAYIFTSSSFWLSILCPNKLVGDSSSFSRPVALLPYYLYWKLGLAVKVDFSPHSISRLGSNWWIPFFGVSVSCSFLFNCFIFGGQTANKCPISLRCQHTGFRSNTMTGSFLLTNWELR